MVASCHGAAAMAVYFQATRPLVISLAQLFRHAFPSSYEEYSTAFEAGVWYTEDLGPWIGRAIVFKLQVDLHFEMGDGGPTATFPMGLVEGGQMEVLTLKAWFK